MRWTAVTHCCTILCSHAGLLATKAYLLHVDDNVCVESKSGSRKAGERDQARRRGGAVQAE